LHQDECLQLALLWQCCQQKILGRCVSECQKSIALLLGSLH
jgi:hypothetical protein